MKNEKTPANYQKDLQETIDEYEKAGGDKNTANVMRSIKHAVDNLPDPPPGGYLRVWKKKWRKRFGPKTNWNMLATLVGLAALLAMYLLR